MKVIIRRLKVSDGEISWKWRNDPEVWQFTGRKWFGEVDEKTEKDWIKEVIKRENEFRFAICVGEDEQYIGNVQLTNIENGEGEFHIFIGEKSFWGKGVGNTATRLMVNYGFNQMGLSKIYLFVREENIPAIKAYYNCGFKIVSRDMDGALKMEVRNS